MSLEIKRHIVAQDWMRSPQVEKLFTALQGRVNDDEPQALFVGGCVRNVLLGKDVEDYDVATPLAPEHVVEILEREGAKVIPTGIDHGTVTAVIDDMVFEVTTLRKDEETDGRHAVVSYTDSWVEDAERRDFTINTLLLDPSGNVYDPLNKGLKDLDKRLVRFVGNPSARIEEDHLRILRFFRFSAIYGREFDETGLKACQRAADSIDKLSKERITQEFFKIIASDKPYEVLDIMFKHDVLSSFRFTDYDPEFFKHFCTFQSRYGLNALSSRLFVFANLNMINVKAMERFILFPKVFLKDMQALQGALTLPDLSNEQAVKEGVYRYGRSITAQALMIELVQDRVMSGYAPTALGIIQEWDVPDFPVSGNDLKEKGIPEGPEMGKELKRLEQEWIDGGFQSQ